MSFDTIYYDKLPEGVVEGSTEMKILDSWLNHKLYKKFNYNQASFVDLTTLAIDCIKDTIFYTISRKTDKTTEVVDTGALYWDIGELAKHKREVIQSVFTKLRHLSVHDDSIFVIYEISFQLLKVGFGSKHFKLLYGEAPSDPVLSELLSRLYVGESIGDTMNMESIQVLKATMKIIDDPLLRYPTKQASNKVKSITSNEPWRNKRGFRGYFKN